MTAVSVAWITVFKESQLQNDQQVGLISPETGCDHLAQLGRAALTSYRDLPTGMQFKFRSYSLLLSREVLRTFCSAAQLSEPLGPLSLHTHYNCLPSCWDWLLHCIFACLRSKASCLFLLIRCCCSSVRVVPRRESSSPALPEKECTSSGAISSPLLPPPAPG